VSPTGLSSAYSFQKVGDRYYDPALMCFLTRDTELGQLPYTYCDGDPVNHIDPTGHFLILLLAVVVVGGVLVYYGWKFAKGLANFKRNQINNARGFNL